MPNDVDQIMSSYVTLCIDDWIDTSDALRTTARNGLPPGIIAENESDAIKSISSRYDRSNQHGLQFIPMPTDRERTGCFFFLPIQVYSNGTRVALSFELLWIRKDQNCIAFRFEPIALGRHGYSHIQLCRTLRGWPTGVCCLPQWIPDSYPAFPSPARDQLGMFLSMATAVHGFDNGGFRQLLMNIFQKANRSDLARSYLDELDKLLGAVHSATP